MKIPEDLAHIRYALAVVRLNAVGDPGRWKLQEVLDAFAALPTPAVSFEEFCQNRGFEVTTIGEKNDEALAALKGIIPDAKKE
jgi:hypothetical protein